MSVCFSHQLVDHFQNFKNVGLFLNHYYQGNNMTFKLYNEQNMKVRLRGEKYEDAK